MHSRFGRLAPVLAALILAASCGSSGSKNAASTTTTSTVVATTTTSIPSDAAIEGPGPSELPTQPAPTRPPAFGSSTNRQAYVTTVFDDIQSMWSAAFRDARITYRPSTLRTFTSVVGTSCGEQRSEVGPFYCTGDLTVYLDLRFFDALAQQTGAAGDFTMAYVIAHEMGHHIQNLLGVYSRVGAANDRNPAGENALSIRVELQADCYAGVWAHSAYTRNLVQPGDLEEALSAAAAVGDDFLQHLTTGQVEPDNWTHGTSAQRQHWLTVGYDSGSPAACDTFSGSV